MKTLIQSTVLLFFISAGLSAAAPPVPAPKDPVVNAYGEPIGFGNQSEVILPNSKELNISNSRPGTGGMYAVPGTTNDVRNSESSGEWQARAAVPAGNVIIGPVEVVGSGPTGPITPAAREEGTTQVLEVLGSGPTGPMTPEARATARDEVTTQVLDRIRATDKIMSDLESRSATLDKDAQVGFKTAATAVTEAKNTLREDLKTLRAATDAQWGDARLALSVSFNAYVQSTHRAEESSIARART